MASTKIHKKTRFSAFQSRCARTELDDVLGRVERSSEGMVLMREMVANGEGGKSLADILDRAEEGHDRLIAKRDELIEYLHEAGRRGF